MNNASKKYAQILLDFVQQTKSQRFIMVNLHSVVVVYLHTVIEFVEIEICISLNMQQMTTERGDSCIKHIKLFPCESKYSQCRRKCNFFKKNIYIKCWKIQFIMNFTWQKLLYVMQKENKKLTTLFKDISHILPQLNQTGFYFHTLFLKKEEKKHGMDMSVNITYIKFWLWWRLV